MKTVAIIGLGLIGSSICFSLKQSGKYTVFGYDCSPDNLECARKLDFCHKFFASSKDCVKDAHIIILASPMSQYVNIIKRINPNLKSSAILTDVGSVKGFVIQEVLSVLKSDVYFVPAHPIAGSEKSGASAGFSQLFSNRFLIICPLDNVPPAINSAVQQMWEDMGSIVEFMSAEKHDKILSITSHLPHLLAYALVKTACSDEVIHKGIENSDIAKYSAGGFRDSTRVAASDPTMWRDIFLQNKDEILQFIKLFEQDLSSLKGAIKSDDGEFLTNWFLETKAIRSAVIGLGQEDYRDKDTPPSIKPYGAD